MNIGDCWLSNERRPVIIPTDVLATPLQGSANNQFVVDTLTPAEHDEQVQSYEDSFREAIAAGGSIYGSMSNMPVIIQAAHERRIQLLDSLPIGDVQDKICVDYGVGSWGFACIYPKLQNCAYAIGIDISYAAIQESAAISAKGDFPYGSNYVYLTSRGDDIKLKDQTVDIFFTGECIEHVENTEAFLDEIHRILKPKGLLILTTPNADAYLYRINGDSYAVGPEHVALMQYSELRDYLDSRFDILIAHGFNGSFHYTWDDKITDIDVARAWAAQFADRPDLGTGVILLAQRRENHHPSRYQQHYYHHDAPEIQYKGRWQTVPLHKSMTGRLGSGGTDSALTLSFEGNGIIINFWCHSWSGETIVDVDGTSTTINLFSTQGGFNRVHIDNLPSGKHCLHISGSQTGDPRSQGNEVIFYQAISYQRQSPEK